MARGRKTGGRRKGSRNKIAPAKVEAANSGLLPLEYMLTIMRNEALSGERRDHMAKAAAPYMHRALKSVEHTGEAGGPIQYEVTLSFE